MVNVGLKPTTQRVAVASGSVFMEPSVLRLFLRSDADGRQNLINPSKGNILTLAQVAGVFGAKKCSELIPLCHNVPLEQVLVDTHVDLERGCVRLESCVRTTGKTGAEMEALCAVSVAALTVYDMCKSATKDIRIGDIRLDYKSGGKSGEWKRGATLNKSNTPNDNNESSKGHYSKNYYEMSEV